MSRVVGFWFPIVLFSAGAYAGPVVDTVDLSDYAVLPQCLTGPGVGLDPPCDVFDLDADTDLDLIDFAEFQRAFLPPPGMQYVPGGEFEMGDPFDEGEDDELPVHTVYLSPYYIDKYEVTNGRYAAALNWAFAAGQVFVHETDHDVRGTLNNIPYCDTTARSEYSRITWDGSAFGVAEGKENHPITRVTWQGAAAYCNWRSAMEGRQQCYDLSTFICDFTAPGYRLPKEAEWEKASAWDAVELRHFRFGENSDGCGRNCLAGGRGNFFNSGQPFAYGGSSPGTTPVGFYNGELHAKEDFDWPGGQLTYQTQDAASYYGCYDMSGNVWEWCNDRYDPDYYDASPSSNPTGPADGTERVLRGGAWNEVPVDIRSARRIGRLPGFRFHSYGFRCAKGTP
ncbi:MAG: SUMF1/EgtB/PvdO family nonheme iron enzyme [Phycisphaerae bacterium]